MRTNNQLYSTIRPSRSFYYDGLTYKEKMAYDSALRALTMLDKEVNIGYLNSNEITNVFASIHYDHPEIYYFDFSEFQIYPTPKGSKVELKYHHLDRVDEIKNRLNEIIASFKKGSAIDYMLNISKIVYEFKYLDSKRYEEHSIFDPLIKRTGVCEGFSLLFCLLCRRCGIDCICVHGNLGKEPHLWNIVELGGKLYNVDITSSLSVYSNQQLIKFAYFLVPNSFLTNHKPELRFDCSYLDHNPFVLSDKHFSSLSTAKAKMEKYAKEGKDFVLLNTSNNDIDIQAIVDLKVPGISNYYSIERYYKFIVQGTLAKAFKSIFKL